MKKSIEEEFENKLNEYEDLSINNERYNSSELLISVESILKNHPTSISKNLWYKYLKLTRLPFFLENLKDKQERYRYRNSKRSCLFQL